MRLWRAVLPALVLLVALLPAQCGRDDPAPGNKTVALSFRALPLADDLTVSREGSDIALAEAWEMSSPHTDFGSVSGLRAASSGRLVAVSDRGLRFSFAAPPADPAPVFELLAKGVVPKEMRDAEATAKDGRGTEWVAFEGADRLTRRPATGKEWQEIATPATKPWASNSGVEAMTFLSDGRLLLIEEGHGFRNRPSRALLYPATQPLADPVRFTFLPSPGYRPTGAATLPDGRVLILLRAVRFMPPGFTAKIVVADPGAIAEGVLWEGREIARIAAPAPVDNMEGIAIAPRRDGALDVWLVSDDNGAGLQRTVLLRLVYRPGAADAD